MESSSSESEDGDEQVERDEREENKGTSCDKQARPNIFTALSLSFLKVA